MTDFLQGNSAKDFIPAETAYEENLARRGDDGDGVNKDSKDGKRDELIEKGYVECKHCGSLHDPKFSTCFRCRDKENKPENLVDY